LRGWFDTPAAARGYANAQFVAPAAGMGCDRPSAPGKRSPARIDPIAMKAVQVTLLIIGTMIARNPALAADAAYGEYLASECVTCHGANADVSIPALDALRYEQLIAALKAYRSGSRTNPVMQSVARSLDDAAIEALAAYFSGQP
jgi:cytochrome c553